MSISTEKPQGPIGLTSGEDLRSVVFNLPNQLTWLRLALTVVMFGLISWEYYAVSLVMFLVAASTDWLDGYFARKYNLVTTLGRILDPFADKVIICGTFIYLAAVPPAITGESASEIAAWMAVVVVARELLVTALRSFFEEHGTDFSAKWAGKWKMVLQCAAVAASLARLWHYRYEGGGWDVEPPAWSTWSVRLLVWAAIAMTVYSGWGYVQAAVRLLRSKDPGARSMQ